MSNTFLRNDIIYFFLFFTLLLSHTVTAQEAETKRFKHTISKGSGEINLLLELGNKDISPVLLETLRNQNNGEQILGVSINEASSGSEKASSQGVAVEHLTLTVTTGEDTFVYQELSTKTKSLLAKVDTETRQFYYTLLGRTGSNNITGSNLHGTSFDGTLSIPVDIDLSDALNIY